MKNKYHVKLSFKWFDFWIGFFFDHPAKSIYICLLPMLPIKIWATEHKACSKCGAAMQKKAADISPEGFDLFWECPQCDDTDNIDFNVDFGNTDGWISEKDLVRFGYEVV